jgi:hypothetical protein
MTARLSQGGGDFGGGGGGGGVRSARPSDSYYPQAQQRHNTPAGAATVLPARSPRPPTPPSASARASPAFDRRPAALADYRTDPDFYALP